MVILQTFVFVSLPFGVNFLQTLFGMAIIDLTIVPLLMLHFVFGIALALIRVYTGSLWAAIGFHLGYLAMARFFIMPAGYGAPPIVTFQETTDGLGALFLVGVIMFGSIVVWLLLLAIRRWRRKKK